MSEESLPLQSHPLSTIEEVPSIIQSAVPSPESAMSHDDSDEEEFVYPGTSSGEGKEDGGVLAHDATGTEHAEEPVHSFVYPGAEDGIEQFEQEEEEDSLPSLPTPPSFEPELELDLPSVPTAPPSEVLVQPPVTVIPPPPPPLPTKSHPTPAQLEAIQAAASDGSLPRLKQLFQNAVASDKLEAFALTNDASPRTGLTALHAAASRGHLEIVKWRTSRIDYVF
ncbi:hypothetical protein BDW22DRAFT_522741 [Trametopsis cervina]|nr:hypothetical protein BDW22DRAFT_522741 [Trametopsis cervina]